MLRSSETGNHPNSFVDCNNYLATLKAMSCENCFCRDFPAMSKLDCYRFLGRPCADGMMELVESVPGVARVETAESAEIASIRSDLNRVLKLVEPGSKRKPKASILRLKAYAGTMLNWVSDHYAASLVLSQQQETTTPTTSCDTGDWGFIKPPAICDRTTLKETVPY